MMPPSCSPCLGCHPIYTFPEMSPIGHNETYFGAGIRRIMSEEPLLPQHQPTTPLFLPPSFYIGRRKWILLFVRAGGRDIAFCFEEGCLSDQALCAHTVKDLSTTNNPPIKPWTGAPKSRPSSLFSSGRRSSIILVAQPFSGMGSALLLDSQEALVPRSALDGFCQVINPFLEKTGQVNSVLLLLQSAWNAAAGILLGAKLGSLQLPVLYHLCIGYLCIPSLMSRCCWHLKAYTAFN